MPRISARLFRNIILLSGLSVRMARFFYKKKPLSPLVDTERGWERLLFLFS